MVEFQKFHIRLKKSKDWQFINFGDLWHYRDLIRILTVRDIKLRYKQTAIGVTWVVLQPLLTSAIFSVIFGLLADLPSDENNYLLFTFSGLMAWNIFSQALQRSGQSLVKENQMITKIYFPRIIIPLSSTLSVLIDFMVSLVVFILLSFLIQGALSWKIVFLPLFLLLNIFISLGVGFLISSLSVFYRDFMYALPFLIQAWMYASPVAYSSSLIPPRWEFLFSLNPMVGIIGGFRWSLHENQEFPLIAIISSIVVGIIIFILGGVVFKRLEKSFADVV